MISARELDFWGMDRGLIDRVDNYDNPVKKSASWKNLIYQRNDMVRKLRAGATSDNYAESNPAGSSPSFSIDVNRSGSSYRFRSAADAFRDKSLRLPGRVHSHTNTLCGQVERIKQRVDVAGLPPGIQLQIDQVGRRVRKFERDCQRQQADFEEEVAEIEAWIKRHYEQAKLPRPDEPA